MATVRVHWRERVNHLGNPVNGLPSRATQGRFPRQRTWSARSRDVVVADEDLSEFTNADAEQIALAHSAARTDAVNGVSWQLL